MARKHEQQDFRARPHHNRKKTKMKILKCFRSITKEQEKNTTN